MHCATAWNKYLIRHQCTTTTPTFDMLLTVISLFYYKKRETSFQSHVESTFFLCLWETTDNLGFSFNMLNVCVRTLLQLTQTFVNLFLTIIIFHLLKAFATHLRNHDF